MCFHPTYNTMKIISMAINDMYKYKQEYIYKQEMMFIKDPCSIDSSLGGNRNSRRKTMFAAMAKKSHRSLELLAILSLSQIVCEVSSSVRGLSR